MIDLLWNEWNLIVLSIGLLATFWCKKKYDDTKSKPLLTCLPGVWTSLGLLGTFCAICLSLHGLDANSEVIDNTGKTLAEVKTEGGQVINIMQIISKLIPAFTTSIIGLIGALAVTLWSKTKFAKEEVEENSKLANTTPEEYIRDIAIYSKEMTYNKPIFDKHNELLAELISLHKEEEKRNREYNDKLNNNISHQSEILKEFIDGFIKRMDEIFKQMHGAIQKQVHEFGEEQFTKTSQLLTSITERLSTVSEGIIDSQRKSVETMMNSTNSEIGKITTSVTEALDSLTKEVQTSLAALNSQQSDRLNTIINNYDSLATKLSEQNNDFAIKITEQLQRDYLKVQEHNVNSLQQMVDLRTAYQEATSDILSNTLQMNEKATSDLRESITVFVNDLQSIITTQCTELGTAISNNVESLNKAYRFIETLVAEIRQNYEQAVLAYGDAVVNVHRTNETTGKAILENNKSLQAIEETNQMISKVLDILTNRQENIEHLIKQINSVSGTIVELQKLESVLNKIANNR
ncbi:MAG: hypothetical protein J6K31_00940 [Parabacteroides sp.]|nr:hypothetical protein [Parabacteroides sp.]